MNKAVFIFTLLVKFSNLSSIFGLLFLAFGVPLILSAVAVDGKTAGLLTGLVSGPTLAMAISYTFIQDNIANTRQLNDGEYLSLLFSRPLARSEYIVSKWLAGSVGVFTIMLINICTFNAAQLLQSRTTLVDFDVWSIANLALNALSYSALMVLIRSFPMRLGITVFVILVYASLIGPALNFSMSSYEATLPIAFYFFQFIVTVSNFLHQFVYPGIDIYEIFNSTCFSILPLVTYASNVLLYLFLATVLLNRREFSYG
ncbi:MAG: hypothetical protein K2X81_28015, partial [Candidatus Obscuribacterales bacterium]|nr:hypothetical protein [Candidatus Obscuribacterales bacterium]